MDRHDQIPRLCTHLQTSESGSYAGESGGHTREAKTTSNSVGINETPLVIKRAHDRQVAGRSNRPKPAGTDNFVDLGNTE